MGNQQSNIPSLAYTGVQASTPPQLLYAKRAPTVNDFLLYTIGTIWMETLTENIWMLTKLTYNSATWTPLGGGTIILAPNSVVQTNATGNLIATQGLNGQVLIGKTGDTPLWRYLTCPDGSILFNPGPNSLELRATGIPIVLAANGVVQTDNAGALFSDSGTDGQVLISSSTAGHAPKWANITSLDSSVTIVNGDNTIDLSVAGGSGGVAANPFRAYQSNNVQIWLPNGAATEYYLGDKCAFTTQFDLAGGFYPGDGTGGGNYAYYEIPISGVYFFLMQISFELSNISMNGFFEKDDWHMYIGKVPDRTNLYFDAHGLMNKAGNQYPSFMTIQMSTVLPLTFGDLVTFSTKPYPMIYAKGGNVSLNYLDTWVSGYRIA